MVSLAEEHSLMRPLHTLLCDPAFSGIRARIVVVCYGGGNADEGNLYVRVGRVLTIEEFHIKYSTGSAEFLSSIGHTISSPVIFQFGSYKVYCSHSPQFSKLINHIFNISFVKQEYKLLTFVMHCNSNISSYR